MVAGEQQEQQGTLEVPTVAPKTSNYTVASTDLGDTITASGTLTITLPDITGDTGVGFFFWCVNAGTGDITLDGDGNDFVNGGATHTVKPGESFMIQALTATSWGLICDRGGDVTLSKLPKIKEGYLYKGKGTGDVEEATCV